MTIEILYPEICNLFGDSGNIRYLKKCLPDAVFIETFLHSRPAFADGKSDMIFMGPMTERAQIKVIGQLSPYKDELKKAIDDNKIILFTGNAMEVLFKYIITDDNKKTDALGIFDFYAKQQLMHRFNSIEICRFNEIDIVGFKTQFTMTYGDNSTCFFANVERGIGINEKSKLEGIHTNNFFGTNLIGPILVLNPYFTEYLMSLLGIKNPKVAFREEAIKAYNARLKDLRTCKFNEH